MEKSKELAFEVAGGNTLDDVLDDAFFDSGVEGVKLVKGSIDVAAAAKQNGPDDGLQPSYSGQAEGTVRHCV